MILLALLGLFGCELILIALANEAKPRPAGYWTTTYR